MVWIHWKSLESVHDRTAKVLPLYQRLKTLDTLSLGLEQYRRASSGFRNLSPAEISEIKTGLTQKFETGVTTLDQLDPTQDDRPTEMQLKNQLKGLLDTISEIEPMLFSKDAYVKPKVQAQHDDILNTLSKLVKNTDSRVAALHLDGGSIESRSLIPLSAVGAFILLLMGLFILRTYLSYQKPLKNLYSYAALLKDGKPIQENTWVFNGMYDAIHSVLSKQAQEVDTLVKNRHQFILDIVDDLRGPLEMLRAGKLLMTQEGGALGAEYQYQTLETVRRGLAIFSGSLEDLNDLVGINQLSSRLTESTVDLAELLTDVSRVLFGVDFAKRGSITVPPIPVWVNIDVARFERALFHIISRVAGTLPQESGVAITVNPTKGSLRGIEITVHEAERSPNGLPIPRGPEQDVLKHWISENGLCMTLIHKVVKSHGGTITASGLSGSSVSITIRIPHERVTSNGLISPPGSEHLSRELEFAGSLVFRDQTKLERAKGLEPSTSTLATWRSSQLS